MLFVSDSTGHAFIEASVMFLESDMIWQGLLERGSCYAPLAYRVGIKCARCQARSSLLLTLQQATHTSSTQRLLKKQRCASRRYCSLCLRSARAGGGQAPTAGCRTKSSKVPSSLQWRSSCKVLLSCAGIAGAQTPWRASAGPGPFWRLLKCLLISFRAARRPARRCGPNSPAGSASVLHRACQAGCWGAAWVRCCLSRPPCFAVTCKPSAAAIEALVSEASLTEAPRAR